MVRGAQNALGNGSVPVNPGRVMPITVNAARFRRIRLPTSEGSPSNVPCHNPSLITTTAFSHGRGFVSSDCAAPGENAVVVISDGLWQGTFEGDPSLVGKRILLDRAAFTVSGITRP